MSLTAEARERMEHTLYASNHRSITIRREDVRDTLEALDAAGAQADHAYAELALAQAAHDAPPKPWTLTAIEWLGILLLVVFAAYLGWMGGAGRL